MFDLSDLDVLLSDLKKQRRNVKNELRRAPEGSLRITKNGNYLTYLHITHKDGKRTAKAIGRDPALICLLAGKEYNMRLLNTLNHNIQVLEKARKNCIPDDPKTLLAGLPKHYDSLERDKILDRRLISVSDWPCPKKTGVAAREPQLKLTAMTPEEWAAMPYKENTKHPEHKVHVNRRGLLCRSKSEVLVTNEYDVLKIFYHYDEVIMINGYHLSPDVIGLTWDGTFKYHEHKGLDTEEYKENNKFKESLYEDAGIVQGRNLIITYDSENGSLNTKLLREILIDAYLM
jgi:hypothetical protein